MLAERVAAWTSASPWRYPTIPLLLSGGLVAASWRPSLARAHAPMVVIVLGALRFPALALPELNPDESEDIANAATLLADPRYGLSAEGHTHGPLAILANALPLGIGLPMGYGASRLLGVVMLVATCLLVRRVLGLWFGGALARVAVTPLVLGLAWLSLWDFVAFNGEHTLLVLCAAGGALAAAATGGGRGHVAGVALAGACLGAVGLVKLQGLPIVAGIGALALGVWRSQPGGAARAAAFIAAGLMPAIAFAAYGWWSGQLAHLWISYVLSAFDQIFWQPPAVFVAWLASRAAEAPFVPALALLAVVQAAWLWWRGHRGADNRRPLIASAVVLAAAVLAVYRPGSNYDHYLLLLFPAVALVAGACLGVVVRREPDRAAKAWMAAYLAATAGVPLVVSVPRYRTLLMGAALPPEPRSAAASEIARYVSPGDRLIVWGWAPRLYLETGAVQGTRYAHAARAMEAFDPRHAYYLRLFLEDFDRCRPVVFADSGHKYEPRAEFDPGRFPALAGRLDRDYTRRGEVDGVRIYVSRQRLRERGLEGARP